jgi:hypothetical protein
MINYCPTCKWWEERFRKIGIDDKKATVAAPGYCHATPPPYRTTRFDDYCRFHEETPPSAQEMTGCKANFAKPVPKIV